MTLARHHRTRGSLALGIMLLAFSVPGYSQSVPSADSVLEFRGISAGASLESIAGVLQYLGGGPLRCSPSTVDPSLNECRAIYRDRASGKPVELWMAAIDSLSGILTLKMDASAAQIESWRQELATL
jgi:hypothetical protein